MILLNLETTNKQEEMVKTYLQENASEVLADKINNGVNITKDNKTLINKKTLKGFMKYACDEAHKQAENGATSAMIEDSVVYGWAIHYFEEDSIEGDLYYLDGSKYEPPKPVYKPSIPSTPKPIKQEKKQPSLFDMFEKDNSNKQEEIEETEDEVSEEEIQEAMEELHENDEPSIDEICDKLDKSIQETKPASPLYKQYLDVQSKYPDCIICYRVGDFYEILGSNAEKVADKVDLTLTGRDCGLPERIPMVGFPYHCAEIYFSKLVDKGYKLAICEKQKEYIKEKTQKIDTDTGEVIHEDNDLINTLREQLGNIFEVKLWI